MGSLKFLEIAEKFDLLLTKLKYNGTAHFKKCKQSFECQHLETFGGQSSNLYLNVAHFATLVKCKHLWQLKTVVFLH
jgi:hypothetical protein